MYQAPGIEWDKLKDAGLHERIPLAIEASLAFLPLDSDALYARVCEKNRFATPAPHLTYHAAECTQFHRQNSFEIIIDSAFVALAKTLKITDCQNFIISGKAFDVSHALKFLIEIKNCQQFSIRDMQVRNGRNGIIVQASRDFALQNCSVTQAHGYGVIIHNSRHFSITHCLFAYNLAAGVMALGDCADGWIAHSFFKHSQGFLNQDAGVHLCATSPAIGLAQIPELCHEALSIKQKTLRPHYFILENNVFSHCRAQGIYCEGTLNALIRDNWIHANNKEGICFDWGCCYNLLVNNTLSANGARAGLSAEEIKADFISEYPLLDDGSSSMKLPAISLDNGCMNLIERNHIINNFGGGIKCVRADFFNHIKANQIINNAIGSNQFVPYFHGITLLGIGAINNEFTDCKANLLDFLPTLFNRIAHNTLKLHWLPIFADQVSQRNHYHDNISDTLPNQAQTYRAIVVRILARLRRLFFKVGLKL